MQRRYNILNAAKIAAAKPTGKRYKLGDGNGLYLVVDAEGAKRWLFRTVNNGKRCDLGLGGITTRSLASARAEAAKLRAGARHGLDIMADKGNAAPWGGPTTPSGGGHGKPETRKPMTVKQAAEAVAERDAPGWGQKGRTNFDGRFKLYVFPKFGGIHIADFGAPQILACLVPIWREKGETARKLRAHIASVIGWAKANGYRSDNCMDDVEHGLPKGAQETASHVAMPYADIAAFLPEMRKASAGIMAKLALEFTILTAKRSGEVLGARWQEVSEDEKLWTIPPARQQKTKRKTGKTRGPQAFPEPLTPRALEIFAEAKAFVGGNPAPDDFIFPASRKGGKLPHNAMSTIIARMGLADVAKVHGFRSAFTDWAADKNGTPPEVREAALAHKPVGKVNQAYLRTQFLDLRRPVMHAWAAYCLNPRVVPLKRAA